MSGLRQFSDGRRLERSGFVQTCNLLSRYIKEKGSLRDLNIEIGGKVESLEAIVKPGSTRRASASRTSDLLTVKGKSMAPISSIDTVEDSAYKSISKEATSTDTKPSQLTIFYSGRVLVFDDYPAEKAKELVAFANQQSSQMSCGTLSNTFGTPSCPVASTSREGLPPRPQASTSSQKTFGISSITRKEQVHAPQPEANASDLPIARRSSLHRFLAKRKDRAVARGPYHQVPEQPSSSSKADAQLELRL